MRGLLPIARNCASFASSAWSQPPQRTHSACRNAPRGLCLGTSLQHPSRNAVLEFLEVLNETRRQLAILLVVFLPARPRTRRLQDVIWHVRAAASARRIQKPDRAPRARHPVHPEEPPESSARVYLMLIRFPTPYGPPTQPVLTSQQRDPWRSILRLKSSA